MADVLRYAVCYRPDCAGIAARGGQACIAHLSPHERKQIIETLRTGSPLDFARGVRFTEELIRDILNSITSSPGVRKIHLADFRNANFTSDVGLQSIVFDGLALFEGAAFEGSALFNEVSFMSRVSFDGATFCGDAIFRDATFNSRTTFRRAHFCQKATFRRSLFTGRASFKDATFSGNVILNDVTFDRKPRLTEVTCERTVELNRAFFPNGVEILELRGSPEIVMEGVALGSSSILSGPREQSDRPRLLSLRGSDVARLLISDVDLRACRFVNTHNLDQLRFERGCEFVVAPGRWRSRRNVIAEEHQLRASAKADDLKPSSSVRVIGGRKWRSGWYPAECRPPQWLVKDSPELDHALAPSEIAGIYRALRRGRETDRDESEASDFYYGEMEMRRHDDHKSRFERLIVSSYWLTSGYGLRASRAFLCLAATVFAFGVLLYEWGISGHVTFAQALTFSAQSTTSLFRAPQGNLTLTGQWLEMGLRLLGPLFFGLALLAIRGRVKR
jgi:uncharacterized protein YjbI with pentapeptide repeats